MCSCENISKIYSVHRKNEPFCILWTLDLYVVIINHGKNHSRHQGCYFFYNKKGCESKLLPLILYSGSFLSKFEMKEIASFERCEGKDMV